MEGKRQRRRKRESQMMTWRSEEGKEDLIADDLVRHNWQRLSPSCEHIFFFLVARASRAPRTTSSGASCRFQRTLRTGAWSPSWLGENLWCQYPPALALLSTSLWEGSGSLGPGWAVPGSYPTIQVFPIARPVLFFFYLLQSKRHCSVSGSLQWMGTVLREHCWRRVLVFFAKHDIAKVSALGSLSQADLESAEWWPTDLGHEVVQTDGAIKLQRKHQRSRRSLHQ